MYIIFIEFMSIFGSVCVKKTYLVTVVENANSYAQTLNSREVDVIAYKITSTSAHFFLWVLAHFITAFAFFSTV